MKNSDWPLKYQISLWKKVLSCLFFYFSKTWDLKLELIKALVLVYDQGIQANRNIEPSVIQPCQAFDL